MTPQDVVRNWANSGLKNTKGAHLVFVNVYRLVGVEMTGGAACDRDYTILDDEEEILRRLALNLARAPS